MAFLILRALICYGLHQTDLIGAGNIFSSIARVTTKIVETAMTLFIVKKWFVIGNLVLFFDDVRAINLNCDTILSEAGCPNENITFWLYTNTTKEYQLKEYDRNNLRNAPFIRNSPIELLIHGYTGNKSYAPNPQIRPEYLALGHNVISVDYGPIALSPCYIQAVNNLPTISNCTARLIIALSEHANITKGSIHVIGLSLGAHVAGMTGSLLIAKNADLKLKRITGLDPAGPLFILRSYIKRKCADFVQVIHTNVGEEGRIKTDAHINFYMNDGTNQPTCNGHISCSHEISATYYGEAINSSINPTKGFYGIPFQEFKCTKNNQVIMGPYTSPKNYNPSVYSIATNSEAPFGKGPVC